MMLTSIFQLAILPKIAPMLLTVALAPAAIAGMLKYHNRSPGSIADSNNKCRSEDHIARDCDQPRNLSTVTCRNCEKSKCDSCPEDFPILWLSCTV